MTRETALLWIWALMWVLAVPGLLTKRRIILLLQSKHQYTWKELGSPVWFRPKSLGSSLPMIKFVWSESHKRLDDKELSGLVGRQRALEATLLTLFVVFACLVFF